MKYLRKATAAVVAAGPFVAAANGAAPLTGLTTGSTLNGRIVSNGVGAAFTPAAFTHDANGYYLVPLAAGDVPAAGRLRLELSDPATYLPVWEDFAVLEPAVYDSLFGTAALSTFGGFDSVTVETGVNMRQAMSLVLAHAAGKSTYDPATGNVVIYAAGDPATVRITSATTATLRTTTLNPPI